MPNEPSWLDTDSVVALNRLIVEGTGEPFGIVHPGSLDSAVARPRNRWAYGETDVVVLAVDLCVAIARSHPFLQGNKRTAFAAMDGFLAQNGWDVSLEDRDESAEALVRVLTQAISPEEFSMLIEGQVRRTDPDEALW